MWPRRKILFIIPRGIKGWQGILSLLEALHIDVIVRETTKSEPADLTDLTFPRSERELSLSDTGATEILYWPEIPAEDVYRQWGLNLGLSQFELSEFLHRYWEEEIILTVNSNVLAKGMPLLWTLLQAGDFEPSLLWNETEEKWIARIGRGLHWVIPEDGYKTWCKEAPIGRKPVQIFPNSYWQLQEERVDFYADPESSQYLGSLTPYAKKEQAQVIYDTVLRAHQLGVPWRNLKNVYDNFLNTPRDDVVVRKTV